MIRALLLVVFAGLGSQDPDLEIEHFKSFAECRLAANRHIEAGRYAQCAAGLPDFRWYPDPDPSPEYMRLWIKPLQADSGEAFLFLRPTMVICAAEVQALRAKGHTANCRGGGRKLARKR